MHAATGKKHTHDHRKETYTRPPERNVHAALGNKHARSSGKCVSTVKIKNIVRAERQQQNKGLPV